MLWMLGGATTSTMASILRSLFTGEQGLSSLNIALSAVFTLITVGSATIGISSLTDRRRQMQVLAGQRTQLMELSSQAQAYATAQSGNLVEVISQIVAPEIERLRTRVESLDVDSSIDRLQALQNEIADESTQMVRTISHEMVPPPERIDVSPTPILSTWRDSVRLVASARISGSLTILSAVLLFIAQFNLGCFGVPTLAVLAFLVVTLGVGALGRLGPLSHPPIGLIWLTIAFLSGFAAYRYMLNLGPAQCTWTSTGWESAIGLLTAFTLFLGLTVVVQASAQAAEMVHDLRVTNEQIADVTRQFNLAGSLTQAQVSQFLHGPIQGRLAAAAMALRLHMDRMMSGERPAISQLSADITVMLDEAAADLRNLSNPSTAAPLRPTESIRQLALRWGGFLETTIDVETGTAALLDENPAWAARVVQCAEEALTNASRHGLARHARIIVSVEGSSHLSLRVFDDGQGPVQGFQMGLGLKGITTSGGVWDLAPREGGGSVLRVLWPLP